jgi:hypothetical protein
MTPLWRLLSGDIPGGLAILLTALVAFLAIWEFVYRTGETLPARTYRKWRLFGPLIIIVIYALFWLQSPPKVEPLRIAVLPKGGFAASTLQTQGIADLAARSLRKTLNRALINPWEGSADYPAPNKEAAERAGYKVFESEVKEPSEVFTLHDKAEFNNLYDSSAVQLTVVILSALGKTGMQQAKPFINKPKPEVLADYYSGRFIFQ